VFPVRKKHLPSGEYEPVKIDTEEVAYILLTRVTLSLQRIQTFYMLILNGSLLTPGGMLKVFPMLSGNISSNSICR
jgi:hypothetical protein